MNNLFICLTPLQALIAQQLIRQTAPTPADLLMVCYAEADNDKFRHYYRETAKLCQNAHFVRVPENLWWREVTLFQLKKIIQKQYQTVFAASIDNPNVQFPLSHIQFQKLETFDDGTANLYPDSILYRNQKYGKKARLIRQLQGIKYQTEDLRQLSAQHHTLYPTQNNIASPTSALNLWHNHALAKVSGCLKTQRILLGQPLLENHQQNKVLFEYLLQQTHSDTYYPHPREDYQIENANYIHSPLIFEDYLLQNIQQNPDTEYHIYHIASTAALNVANFPNVKVIALRPNLPLFQQNHFQYLYDLMEKMNIPIQNINLPS